MKNINIMQILFVILCILFLAFTVAGNYHIAIIIGIAALLIK